MKDQLDRIKKEFTVQVRAEEANYFEAVLLVSEYPSIEKELIEFLGEPTKPVGQEPVAHQTQITAEFGGIRKEQILFEKDENHLIAMIWPWQDKQHLTLKIKTI